MLNPFVQWIGGKRQLLSEISKHIPDFDTYYEPFVGGGAVFLALMPKKAVISDSNQTLIDCYIAIRDDLEELCDILYTFQKEHNEKNYYIKRDYFNKHINDPSEARVNKASGFIYLMLACYNGLIRYNKKGEFNSPLGRTQASIDYDNLKNISYYLKNNDIEMKHCDYDVGIRGFSNRDFIYFDPPYHKTETRYTAKGFNEVDQKLLASLYKELTKIGVRCLLSNSDTPLIRECYRKEISEKYNIIEVMARRSVNCKADGRGKIKELLIKNYQG